LSAEILHLPTGDPLKLRLDIVDGSLLDVFVSASGRYSYHWERRLVQSNDFYRHDNAPHPDWRRVATFPKHFHDGSTGKVVESHISDMPQQAIRQFLTFARDKLSSTSRAGLQAPAPGAS
jgi:hypothetical protein